MGSRVFSYYVTFSEMKEYAIRKGYTVRSAKKIILEDLRLEKEFGDLVKKIGYRPFDYKFMYTGEETPRLLAKLVEFIDELLKENRRIHSHVGKDLWIGCGLWFYLLDVKSRKLMMEEFEEKILCKK